jgi:hypothetical protein
MPDLQKGRIAIECPRLVRREMNRLKLRSLGSWFLDPGKCQSHEPSMGATFKRIVSAPVGLQAHLTSKALAPRDFFQLAGNKNGPDDNRVSVREADIRIKRNVVLNFANAAGPPLRIGSAGSDAIR